MEPLEEFEEAEELDETEGAIDTAVNEGGDVLRALHL